MKLHRLSLAKYADTAFTGEGSRRVGSRWTPVGYPVVYMASSIALAVLETLVHADWSVLPRHCVIPVKVPSTIPIASVDIEALPTDWRATPPPVSLQQFGRDWLDTGEAVLLRVPSVLVPQEFNFILSPAHPDFHSLTIGVPDDFGIDPRLR